MLLMYLSFSGDHSQVQRHLEDTAGVPEGAEDNPHLARRQGVGAPRTVGHWSWKMTTGTAYNNDVGSTKPVDCGGTSRYGPFGMLGLGAHAAMEVNEWPYMTDKGYVKIKALWVPPNDFENILRRRTITIEAYVTFDKEPPTNQPSYQPPQPQISFTYGMQQQQQSKPRWVKLSATILSLDYIDMHNFLIVNYGPWYQQIISGYYSSTDTGKSTGAGPSAVTPEP
ncbi:hypothetical protein BaRGS_00010789 [Batillaria attramentaria]|uniref:Neprosin domain-containing protein n=1 Tax=Batillaria attramentaria TaxID=370345 RepID=A0ABD0LES3_9CAEN